MTRKVLVTTSGIGSRLGNLSKFTNKSLVRIGKKPAISYILDSYPAGTEFVVTLGHYGDQVRQYFNVAHPGVNVTFAEVDKFEGPGSSLLYSISCARKHLAEPFIFHACDTVVQEQVPLTLTTNWLGGFPSRGSAHYRTFNVAGSQVLRLNEKGEKSSDLDYVGVCGIQDYELFWDITDRLLAAGGGLSDYDVIVAMMEQGKPFRSHVFKTWNDIGNIDSLHEARRNTNDHFDLLDKDDESIFILDDLVVKFFYDRDICRNRITRAGKLRGLVPEVVRTSDNFYAYHYAAGNLLSRVITPRKLRRLLDWARQRLWQRVDDDGKYVDRCKKFYQDKTVERISRFLTSNRLADTETTINGEHVPPVMKLLEKVDFASLHAAAPSVFHGDFILENLLETRDGFTMLDWRQDFAGSTDYGDFHYDLAKLNHNLILDHNSVHHDWYSLADADDGMRADILVPSLYNDTRKVLEEFCAETGTDYRKIRILTALVWLNMSPLHERPLDTFLFYFGKYHLHRALAGADHA